MEKKEYLIKQYLKFLKKWIKPDFTKSPNLKPDGSLLKILKGIENGK